MLCSMTGFARVEKTYEQGDLIWELRSVNHRYLDINFRLPEQARSLEPQLRQYLQQQFARGKVDCVLNYHLRDTHAAALEISQPLLESLLNQVDDINQQLPKFTPAKAMDLLAWPGVVRAIEPDMQSFHEQCLSLFKKAVRQSLEMRATEGERLQIVLQERCQQMAGILKQVRKRYPEVLAALRQKQKQRVEELQMDYDQQRFEQELVYMAQKLDLAEELDRLDSHLSEMQAIFSRKEPVGRRLDFLMQEFNREANTVASKSADIETTQATVEIKVLIEQMREQIQNIE